MSNPIQTGTLPIKENTQLSYGLSFAIALLMSFFSLSSLVFPAIYESYTLRQTFLPNDIINLVIGLPVLLGSMWLTWHGKWIGLLTWPGALLYVLYNYIAYLFAMPLSWLTLGYVALVLLSIYNVFKLLRNIDQEAVQRHLSGTVSAKFGGWFLLAFGVLFISRAIGMVAQAHITQESLLAYETGTLIADVLISTLWIICGVFLVRQKPLGYVYGLGLLFVASTLFIGLILFLFLQPFLTNAPFSMTDIVVVSIMGTFCSIPTWLFARGVLQQ